MNVLVACEESQRVSTAFRLNGHRAFSCDLLSCSGGHPEYHIVGDVSFLFDGYCTFYTEDGCEHSICSSWDLIIAHPPCTYFSNATMVNLGRKDYPNVFNDAWKERFYFNRSKSLEFVKTIWCSNCDKIVIENVVGYLNTHFMKPTQIIQPFYFGEPYRKATCLWIKGLPKLEPTNIVKPICKWVRHHLKSKDDLVGYDKGGVYTAVERSRTFNGIANAMAVQWGGVL